MLLTAGGGPRLPLPAVPSDAAAATASASTARPPSWLLAGVAAIVVGGVVLRFAAQSPLWLDEALSVNIAALPLGDMLEALRRDGHPPLYYLLLHGWIQLFGTGDLAVRSLSGVAAVAALPLAWQAGRRYGGRACALATLVLLASSPFAVRYATEARMYSLLVLLVLAGWLAVRRAREEPTAARLVVVAVVGALLLLTHYWSIYLLAVVGAMSLWRAWRGPAEHRRTWRALAVAVAASIIGFLPWLPAFLEQMGSTGTPWGEPARPLVAVAVTLRDYGGAIMGEGDIAGWLLGILVLLAALARPVGGHRVELDLRTRPHARPELLVVTATLAVAIVAGFLTASAFATRYTALIFPLVILLAAYGAVQLPRTASAVVVALLAVSGLLWGTRIALTDRTQAQEVASAIEAEAGPDDLVVYCPDQLGVAVDRLLSEDIEDVTFPEEADPEFVDWVDYQARVDAADIPAIARSVHERAGNGALWLVWFDAYRTHDGTCEQLIDELSRRRPGRRSLVEASDVHEPARVLRFAPAG